MWLGERKKEKGRRVAEGESDEAARGGESRGSMGARGLYLLSASNAGANVDGDDRDGDEGGEGEGEEHDEGRRRRRPPHSSAGA